jgi:outer membrane immunogenic protein
MRLKLPFATGAAALALIAAPAAAQDTGNWTGPYVGGQLGYAFPSGDEKERIEFDTDLNGVFGDTVRTGTGADAFSPGFCGGAATSSANSNCTDDEGEISGGIHAGYDFQFGSGVFGIVGEYGRTSVRDSVSAFSTTPASYTMTRELRDNASVRARFGYAAGETLFYGTGGIAWGRIRNSFTTSNTVNSFTQRGDDDAWGYRVGGGIEHRFAGGFSVGLLYTYTSLDDDSARVRAGGPAPATNPFIRTNAAGTDFRRTNERFDTHAAGVTASFRF